MFFLGILSSVIDCLRIKALIFMNAGVILLNIKTIRKDNKQNNVIKGAKNSIIFISKDNALLNYIIYS